MGESSWEHTQQLGRALRGTAEGKPAAPRLPQFALRSPRLMVCADYSSSPEWDNIDPSDREELQLKMEDGEFW